MTTNRSVIVGVDGSPASLGAVRWAADEAVRLGRPLRIVHALELHGPFEEITDEHGFAVDAATEIRLLQPDLRVTTATWHGEPARVLVELSRHAGLVVVGFANPAAGSPSYIMRLAVEGGFNGVAVQIGLAEKFYWEYAGEVPLILKLNGKTEIPSDDAALSPLNAEVEEAVRLGADAVGYTLYVGTPAQEQDFAQYLSVRRAAQHFGMPLIVWAYPRGSAIEAKGGKDSFYAVDYAARVASELGADVVKVNFPRPEKHDGVQRPYDGTFSTQEAIDGVVRSANRTLVLISGGEKAGDEAMLDKAQQSMDAGATGLIFGRNIWQREHSESLRFAARLREVLEKHPR